MLKGSAGTPRPDAVLIMLDSTNLGRHLMLAAPILALGLPTLMLLNMADDLKARGGAVDVEALSRELGAPVALISAARGAGMGAVMRFPQRRRGIASSRSLELPVLNDIPQCRQWAARVGRAHGYQRAGAALVDAPAGRRLSASAGRAADFPAGGVRRLPGHLHDGQPLR